MLQASYWEKRHRQESTGAPDGVHITANETGYGSAEASQIFPYGTSPANFTYPINATYRGT